MANQLSLTNGLRTFLFAQESESPGVVGSESHVVVGSENPGVENRIREGRGNGEEIWSVGEISSLFVVDGEEIWSVEGI